MVLYHGFKGYPIVYINRKNLLKDFDDFFFLQLNPSYGCIYVHCGSGFNPNHRRNQHPGKKASKLMSVYGMCVRYERGITSPDSKKCS